MEKYIDRNMTQIAQNQIYSYESDDILPDISYIFQLEESQYFLDGLKQQLSKLGHNDILEDTDKIISVVSQYCKEIGASISRQTLINWISKGIVSASIPNRNNVYQLCFALKMNAAETGEFFLKAYLERPFNYKDINELIYCFCLNTNRTYGDALRLIAQAETLPVIANKNALNITEIIGNELKKIKTEEELLSFISENRSGFDEHNKTATEKVNELIEKCIPLAEQEHNRFLNPENPTTVKIDTLLNIIYGYAARKVEGGSKVFKKSISKSNLPKLVKKNFPQRAQLEQIEKHTASYDVIRKALIMLNFYYFFADALLKGIESSDLFDEFVEETELLLNECGYVQLYWRNPYDLMIGYCAYSENPLSALRELIYEYYLNQDNTLSK